MMGQETGPKQSSNETDEIDAGRNKLKRQNATVVDSSESEEYFSESEGSDGQQKVTLTPSHAIQEKITFQIAEDPLIIALPSYNLTGSLQRVFRQQNGKPAPEFVSLTDRGIFIQTDDTTDKGRYFLQLTTTVTSNGHDFTDTQYFTLVVSDQNQQSQSSTSQAGESFIKSRNNVQKSDQTNQPNCQVSLKNKASFQEPGEENIWDQKFQSEHTSMQHFNSQRNKFETQPAKQESQAEPRLSQELPLQKIEQQQPGKASSPLRRKSRSNSDSELRNLQHTQQAVVSQFQSYPEHFKTQKTDEDSSRVSRQPTEQKPQVQNLGSTQKQRQSILRLPTLNNSSGLLKEINMTASQGLVQQTEDQAEESWEDNEGESDVNSQKSNSSESRQASRHPQTQKNAGHPKLFEIEEEASFSEMVAPLIDSKQNQTSKNYASRKSVIVANTTELSQHLEKFQVELKNKKEKSKSRSKSPASLRNSPNKFNQTDMPPEIRNLQIQSTQKKLLDNDVQPLRNIASTTIETDKFISFSAGQYKNFNGNPSPIDKVAEIQKVKSPIKNYQTEASRNVDSIPLASRNQATFFSNGSAMQSHESISTFELSHQEKIKQRSERIRDSNKIVSKKKPSQNQLVPLQEQRENRRRSRGERANQNPGSASPINLTALNHRYFQEGPKFTGQGFNNTQSLDDLKEYQNESESNTQQSLQSTQQYDALMATLNSIQSESLKQSFQYAAEIGYTELAYQSKGRPDQMKQTFGKESQNQKNGLGKSPAKTETTNFHVVEDSSDINSVSTHNAEIVVQSGSHNGKASLQLLIDYNQRKALKQNQKLRDKIQKVKLQMEVEAGVLPEEFNRSRMEETMGLFDLLHEKEEVEINRQLRLQIEAAQDNARKMQGKLQQQEQERFLIIQATQLEAQRTFADEELLLKSYLYDAISQTQNLKLKCNFLGTEKRQLQEKVDLLLDQINKVDTNIAEHEENLLRLEQEQEESAKVVQQNLIKLQPIQSEIESLKNLNEALESQVNDYKVELDARLQDQGQVLNRCDQMNQKQQKLELLIEKNTTSINQFNHECDQMSSEVMRVWSLLQQESSRLQAFQKQIIQEQLENQTYRRNYQLEQQQDYLNQQRAAQIRAIKQAEIDHQNWLLEMEFQRQKELLKLGQQQVTRQVAQVPVQTQTQHLMYTPKRSCNKDNKNVFASQDRSEHTPEPTRQTKQPDNSIFGGNDDLPDSMRFTTTYRQFANNQKFTGKKEGENGGEDVFLQSEASFTRFGTIWDRQEKAPQRQNLSASRERLVNEGQDMAMLLRPGSVTPQNNFKFGVQKFLASPVNKKMMAQLPKLRNELSVLQEQRHMEKRTERRTKLDAQIAFCENRITEIENKISIQ